MTRDAATGVPPGRAATAPQPRGTRPWGTRTPETALPPPLETGAATVVWCPGVLPLAGVAFLFSGLSGLLYEVVWVRLLGLAVGGEAIASQAVLSAYFAGMAAGAALVAPRIDRARAPLRAYALLEIGIAVAAAWSFAALAIVRSVVPQLTSGVAGVRLGAISFAAALFAFAPATVLMGATLPALVRGLGGSDDWKARAPRVLGGLYAVNTVGAVAGSLLAGFVLMETLGSRATVITSAALNVLAAALALVASRRHPAQATAEAAAPPVAPDASAVAASPAADDPAPAGKRGQKKKETKKEKKKERKNAATGPAEPPPLDRRALMLALGLSGFAAIAFEIAAVRVFAATFESTVYSFAATIAAYLLGIALASAAFPALARRGLSRLPPATLLAGAALILALGGHLLRAANPLLRTLLDQFEDSWRGRILSESLTALLLVLPASMPTTVVFLALAPLALRARDSAAGDLGAAYTANTVGGALAPLLVALAVAPLGGSRAVAIVAVVALLVGAARLGLAATPPAAMAAGAVALVAAFLLPRPLFSWPITEGHRLLATVEGPAAAVAVEERGGSRVLRTGRSYFEGGSASAFAEGRQGHLPMLIHGHPKRALVLGIGTGTTVGAVGQHPGVEVDGVELLAEVLDVLRYFEVSNGGVLANPRIKLHQADARSFVRAAAARGRYDVVIADLYHPQQSGVGNLYTREHFEAVRDALAPGGLFMQWLSLYELPPESLASVVRTFLDVFPHVTGWYAHFNAKTGILGLCGSRDPLDPPLDWDGLVARAANPDLREALTPVYLERPLEVLGGFVATRAGLERLTDDAPFNTDDLPFVEHATPRGHASDMALRLRSLDAVRKVRGLPEGPDLARFFGADSDEAARRRQQLGAWQEGIDALIAGQRAQALDDEDGAIEAWKAGLKAAPDFRVNYALLRNHAVEIAQAGRTTEARNIVLWLTENEPDNEDAKALLGMFVVQKPAAPPPDEGGPPEMPPLPPP